MATSLRDPRGTRPEARGADTNPGLAAGVLVRVVEDKGARTPAIWLWSKPFWDPILGILCTTHFRA